MVVLWLTRSRIAKKADETAHTRAPEETMARILGEWNARRQRVRWREPMNEELVRQSR